MRFTFRYVEGVVYTQLSFCSCDYPDKALLLFMISVYKFVHTGLSIGTNTLCSHTKWFKRRIMIGLCVWGFPVIGQINFALLQASVHEACVYSLRGPVRFRRWSEWLGFEPRNTCARTRREMIYGVGVCVCLRKMRASWKGGDRPSHGGLLVDHHTRASVQ